MSKNPSAIAKKNDGNAFFKSKDYARAIEKYSEAIGFDASDVTFFSNRSACYAALNQWEQAADDGKQCVIVDRSFVKGYFRAALAFQNLGNYDAANDYIKRGLGVDPLNADLKRMSREVDESVRQRKVEASIAQAQSQESSNDIPGAYKTVDAALRLDPTNATLNRLMDTIRPKYERFEKSRVSGLSRHELLKEEGDNKYKAADFEGAIKAYTKAIDAIPDKSSDLAIKVYSNRAACYKQLSNFDATIADCTQVLEHRPSDIKSLVRRAQAFEACERYKLALQDVRQVISCGAEACGKTTYDQANGMQHRLNEVIRRLGIKV